MKTLENKTHKLTIYSNYGGPKIETASRDPKYIKRLMSRLRHGDGDWIKIEDANGQLYDVINTVYGDQLLPI